MLKHVPGFPFQLLFSFTFLERKTELVHAALFIAINEWIAALSNRLPEAAFLTCSLQVFMSLGLS
jgi:hypothetical protein